MKTILVLANRPALADAVRSVLDPAKYRVLHHLETWAAEPLFSPVSVDACIVDTELTDVRPIRLIEQIRRILPHQPLIVYSQTSQWEWEEDAYLLGVSHILAKPVRARLLKSLLEREWTDSRHGSANGLATVSSHTLSKLESRPDAAKPLDALREFSKVLSHSLHAKSLLKQFLLLLRNIIGMNRAAIFLRPGTHSRPGDRWKCACAIGISPAFLEQFQLAVDSGIGSHLSRHGRILMSGGDEALEDAAVRREFELLGAQVAVPIMDRESLLGVAMFDGRLTGEFFSHEELSLIFHLLEELGMALKNTHLHDELTHHHQMMKETLDQLGSGCLVVAPDLKILHVNAMAHALFPDLSKQGASFDFHSLPQDLASRVFAALKSAVPPEDIPYQLAAKPDARFRVRIQAFHRPGHTETDAVMVLIEDVTEAERAHDTELEAARLRLVKSMAEHLAHEIGNTLVPLSTTQQLMASEADDPESREDLAGVMSDSIRRIGRLTSQMQYLARDGLRRVENSPLSKIVEEAFQEASSQMPQSSSRLQFVEDTEKIFVSGERAGIKQALVEIILNALQAAPDNPKVEISSRKSTQDEGGECIFLDVRDGGAGFDSATAGRATEPFFSTRAVGLGLGLTVARRILELHNGTLEVHPTEGKVPGFVRLVLPSEFSTNPPGTKTFYKA